MWQDAEINDIMAKGNQILRGRAKAVFTKDKAAPDLIPFFAVIRSVQPQGRMKRMPPFSQETVILLLLRITSPSVCTHRGEEASITSRFA